MFVPISSVAPAQDAPREVVRADRGQLLGIAVLCIDNEPQILDGMQTLLGGWGCRVIKAPDLPGALAEDPLGHRGLRTVVKQGCRAVGINVVDFIRAEPGPRQGQFYRPDGALAIR